MEKIRCWTDKSSSFKRGRFIFGGLTLVTFTQLYIYIYIYIYMMVNENWVLEIDNSLEW